MLSEAKAGQIAQDLACLIEIQFARMTTSDKYICTNF
ncbi:hypothetical protein CPS_4058 [Colwellia psychrerythraea 34H]|uniref:Uncharacterized protein n=1 Tax=Colwellia psychrerythraea (strain 34H / ATCC BAA-681) TaxID=167879 RepID=Q47WV8_COLP3|nr:hypothetical protein CPS_4058 [Colwellia psychrerythraea 34H]